MSGDIFALTLFRIKRKHICNLYNISLLFCNANNTDSAIFYNILAILG